MRRSYSRKYVPKSQSGHLYYVRLKTDVGTFYKIGFTTADSVEARFDYGGARDSRYIDKVLMFTYSDHAYNAEQSLHGCLYDKKAFEKFSANEHFPLSHNGQTELYIEDVLGLDLDYATAQKTKTLMLMEEKNMIISDKSEAQYKFEKISLKVLVGICLVILFPIIFFSVLLYNLITKQSSKEYLLAMFDKLFRGGRGAQRKRDIEIKQKVGAILNTL
ncbi:hypothetical protein [Acinetobacter sp. AS5]|uniref:hypothetical protein n=1 Tax=Acinetobacter sp. AS5 TaxID=3029187 RepID=UPI003B7968BB